MKKILLTLVFILGALNASYAQRYQESVDYMESSARELPFSHNILTTPFVADLQVTSNTIIEKVITEPFADYTVTTDLINLMPTFRGVALAEAVKKIRNENKIEVDILLGALVDVRTVEGKLEIIVSGYPAKYVNFRTAKMEDINLIRSAEMINTHSGDKADVTESPDHKSTIVKENIKILNQ